VSILQKLEDATSIFVPTDDQPVEDLLTKEWLLTNGRGSYASSTIAGCNSRAYHGLLIGSLRPPANRVMALANCLEMVIRGSEVFKLSTFEFSDKFAPAGFGYLKRFRQSVGVHFDYVLDKVELTKSVYLLRDRDVAAVVYDFTSVREPVDFVSRPFVGLRDFHSLQKSYAQLCSRRLDSHAAGVIVRHDTPNSCELLLTCPDANFEKDEQWWLNFVYRVDGERGQNFTEDLWTPGFFKCHVDSAMRIVLWAELAGGGPRARARLDSARYKQSYIDQAFEELHSYQESLSSKARSVKRNLQFPISGVQLENSNLNTADPDFFETLCLSADAFITKRQSSHKSRTTILAGYPWFADWGRDALISLPGLLLVTGRFDEAKSVLTTFAAAADEGMIPNRFDDNSDTTYFNSVDASLWFINAAFQYLYASGDSKTFTKELVPTIRWIVESYQKGTRYGICADSDGLITAGDEQTQLTWMDAKFDGVAFTPRCGKAVEVNALWHNGLRLLAEFYNGRNARDAEHYKAMADKVAEPERGMLERLHPARRIGG